MDIEDLKLFRVVAKHGSISKAADELNFVQSTVTSKIQKLETHFKTRLFHRHRHGVTLTSAGKNLLAYADKITHLFAEAEKTIIDPDIPKGPISVGSMETTAAVRLPAALFSFHNKYPDIEVSLKTGPTAELIDLVLDYQLDGAFVSGPVKHQEITQQKMFEEELVLVAKRNPSQTNGALDLENSTLLVFRQGCSYRKKFEEWMHAEGIVRYKTIEFGSLEAILGCVHAGLGIALLPKSVISRMERHYSLFSREIPEPFGKVTTYFVYRNDVVPTLAILEFLKTVRETQDSFLLLT